VRRVQRRIALEGCLNFRDLGGYPTADGRRVRWRQLFRSDSLHLLSTADVRQLRDDLGLGCVIDLRSTAELRKEGRGLLEAQPMRFHHLPLFDGERGDRSEAPPFSSLGELYFLMIEHAAPAVGKVVTALAESGCPAVFHCAAGKDRTGVISAVLLGLLDVPDEVVVADYAATREQLEAIVDRLMSLEGYQAMLAELPPDTMHAEPETMITLLGRVRSTYGSMTEYARSAGVSAETIATLRARLLD
jgi:protein-tyrosine phosphatase